MHSVKDVEETTPEGGSSCFQPRVCYSESRGHHFLCLYGHLRWTHPAGKLIVVSIHSVMRQSGGVFAWSSLPCGQVVFCSERSLPIHMYDRFWRTLHRLLWQLLITKPRPIANALFRSYSLSHRIWQGNFANQIVNLQEDSWTCFLCSCGLSLLMPETLIANPRCGRLEFQFVKKHLLQIYTLL